MTLWGGERSQQGSSQVVHWMDVILKVLEGAKEGTKVAIKKEKFLIGRSPKCHLCVGSTAVSRKHCAFRRYDAKATIEDLGSRNGTLVNGKKIDSEQELNSGDEVAIGPLKFLVTISMGISNTKKPEVKSVADAVERTAAKSGDLAENDISDWLLEPTEPPPSQAFADTQTIEMDDTNAIQLQMKAMEEAEEEQASEEGEAGEAEESDDKKKKEPGKLPPVPTEPATKHSREAAAEALRNWNRRR